MKSAFLKLVSPLIKLWRTVVKYVRARHIVIADVTGDGKNDIVLTDDMYFTTKQENLFNEEENGYDKQSK